MAEPLRIANPRWEWNGVVGDAPWYRDGLDDVHFATDEDLNALEAELQEAKAREPQMLLVLENAALSHIDEDDTYSDVVLKFTCRECDQEAEGDWPAIEHNDECWVGQAVVLMRSLTATQTDAGTDS